MIPKAAVVNDLSGLGKCSLVAAISVFSCLGVQACPLPTAILSNQTGYESYFMDDYSDRMERYIEEWRKMALRFDAILTGFLANAGQMDHVETFLRTFRTPSTLLAVDPVMGDNGHLYRVCTKELCDRIRSLAFRADVITPNLTEACILLEEEPEASLPVEKAEELAKRLMRRGPARVVITGVPSRERIFNIVGDRGEVSAVSVPSEGGSYSGTGDLMASAVTAGLVRGKHSLTEIVARTAEWIGQAIQEARRDGTDRNDGIAYERNLWKLGEQLS